jgi:hypothetical protein
VDVVIIVDVAYSYDCYHPELDTKVPELIDLLFEMDADVNVALGTYDDYTMDGEWWASWDGTPFTMLHQMSSDKEGLKYHAATLEMIYGGDDKGSAYEALYQAMVGHGYDQDCDRYLDSRHDVKPFIDSSSDAFEGRISGSYDESIEGGGTIGGVGFREGSARVVIVSVDNAIRSREEGDDLPTGACPDAASGRDAFSAINSGGAKVLGINVYEWQDEDPLPQQQLQELAYETESYMDADGDGDRDDPAIFYGSWNWPDNAAVVRGVEDLAGI